jgi:hypothetical protein
MISAAHPHNSQQQYIATIQAPQPTVPLQALARFQLRIPRPLPSSRPHSASSLASSASSLSAYDTYPACTLMSMSGSHLPHVDTSSPPAAAHAYPHHAAHVYAHAQAMHAQQQQQQQQQLKQDASVAQALEIARESPDGASDPTISRILERAITNIWAKVMARPDDYIMTRDEFSVFNFFQHRFEGNEIAIAARARYWDNFSA